MTAGISSTPLYARAAAAAAVAAALWAFTPLTVACLLVLAVVWRWAGRDLSGSERRWVLGVVGTAIIARLIVLTGVFLTTDPWHEQFHSLIPDARFVIQRSLMVLHMWSGDPIGPFYWLVVFDPYGTPPYGMLLAAVQWLFGPAPYALVLLSVCSLVGGSVLLFRLAREHFGPAAALGGLTVLLFWPTWFIWSVSMLRESVQLLLGAVIVWGSIHALNRSPARVLAVVLVALSVAGIMALRAGATAIPVVGAALGVTLALAMRRSMAASFVAVAVVLIVAAAMRPSAQALVAGQVRAAVGRHVGNVRTIGTGYKIADDRFYTGWPEASGTMQFDEGVRFLARAAAGFIVVPLPWQMSSASASGLAILPQQLAWYVLVALAFPGVWLGLRRAPQLTVACAGGCLAGLVIIAPNSGNIGTLVRHRDMIVPFLVWLSALGGTRLIRGDAPCH